MGVIDRSTTHFLAEPLARHLVPVDGIEVTIPEGSSAPAADTGARLAMALLAYVALITAVVTLLPFEFALPTQPRVMLWGGLFDIVANVGLFVPLGFLYAVARQDQGVPPARIFLIALLASSAIESVQLFEVTRFASLSDILANASGAYLGAVLQRGLARRIAMDARTVGRLSLELPLMGLVYLLVPLLWLDGLASVDSATPLWPLLALGLFGASLLSAAQRYHFGPNHLLSRKAMVGAACGWFLLGAFPGLAPRASIVLFVMIAAVAAFVWVRSADRSGARSINRRFESKALSEAAPFYAAYLLLLVAPVAGVRRDARKLGHNPGAPRRRGRCRVYTARLHAGRVPRPARGTLSRWGAIRRWVVRRLGLDRGNPGRLPTGWRRERCAMAAAGHRCAVRSVALSPSAGAR
jgi:glycopeptide antibiotics resistance protein